MSLSTLAVARPVATTLLTLGIILLGATAFLRLRISPVPQIDYPAINVSATMPGASPETMASSVATPLEKHLGQIADVTEMTFSSTLGTTSVTLQFGLDRSIDGAIRKLGMPTSVHGSFLGTAVTFQQSMKDEPLLIASALAAVYIVLGILYESLIHPLTILSTLPSAGIGAVLALMICGTDLSIIAMIGILLLTGVVMKNAIMMIDFALQAARSGLTAHEAIFQACVQRFRPILMTTMVALLSALPLALGTGEGSELRRPLGIAVIGGLLLSQLLTLYTTPVVYLYLNRVGLSRRVRKPRLQPNPAPEPATEFDLPPVMAE